MPAWISAFDRIPQKFGKYYVKVNGMKDVFRQDEFYKAVERYDTFFWLDEDIETIPPQIQLKPLSLIEQIKTGKLTERHRDQLFNLFGINKSETIKRKLNNTPSPVTK